jgi:hypothetical protein
MDMSCGKTKNKYTKCVIGKPFGRSRRRWNGNIIIFLRGVGCENVRFFFIL